MTSFFLRWEGGESEGDSLLLLCSGLHGGTPHVTSVQNVMGASCWLLSQNKIEGQALFLQLNQPDRWMLWICVDKIMLILGAGLLAPGRRPQLLETCRAGRLSLLVTLGGGAEP